ncbi:MAG: AbrB/MazE/SpoVT family DNA-binding domain-containing protein [Alphaproteobacteria bacterium]
MFSLKLIPIGNSIGAIFPKEVLAKLNIQKGDTVFLTEEPDGYRITSYDPDFKKQVETAYMVMKGRKEALKEVE